MASCVCNYIFGLCVSLILLTIPGMANAGIIGPDLPIGIAPVSDTENSQLIGYWDLRERNSFFQVTNTSGEDVRIHVQLYDVERGCAEFDYFDTLTPFDTHVYDVSDLDRNNGEVLAAPDLSGGHGILAVTQVDQDGFINPFFPALTGNMKIQDSSGYEYRTNLAGSGIDFLSFGLEFIEESIEVNLFLAGTDSINFNDVMDSANSDTVIIGYKVQLDPGGIIPTVREFEVSMYDDQENPISCSPAVLGCSPELESGGVINTGLNQTITNSRGGPSLCLGNDRNGYFQLRTTDIDVGEPEVIQFDEVFLLELNVHGLIIYNGLNNSNGIGSMDNAIRSLDFISIEIIENGINE